MTPPSRPARPRDPAPTRRPPAPRTPRTPRTPEPPATAAPPPRTTPTPAADPFGRAVTTYSAGRSAPKAASRTAARPKTYAGPVTPPVVSTGSVARFAERARARRNVARRHVVAAASAAVVVVGLGWLLFASPVLALDPAGVTVDGAGSVVAVDQVQAVVGAHDGTPLPRLDTVALRDELLDVPGVREARVTRAWPTGLTVTLVAREPVAAVPVPADGSEHPAAGFALLDQDGVQVGRVDAAPDGLPAVDVPVGDKRTLTAVLGVLQLLPADLLAQVQGVSAHTQDTVTMQLRDGVRVDWGSANETPLKIAVLNALRASPAAAGASVIDVSAPRLPITK